VLLEFCGLVGPLIVDEEAIYDPRSANDRLLHGMTIVLLLTCSPADPPGSAVP
jgi:hypothetical protein